MAQALVTIHPRIPADLKDLLEQAATATGKSQNTIVVEALIEKLKEEYPRDPKDTGLKYQDGAPIKQGDVVKITNLPGGRVKVGKLKEEVK